MNPEDFPQESQEAGENLLNKKDLIKAEIQSQAKELNMNVNIIASQFGDYVLEEINKEFKKQYGFTFSERDLPQVFVDPEAGGTYYLKSAVEKETEKTVEPNVIIVESIDDVVSGNTMSEELVHFYRHKLQNPEEKIEYMTEEFFGFLGKRFFQKAIQKGATRLDDLEDDNHIIHAKEWALKMSKALKDKSIEIKESIDFIQSQSHRKNLEGEQVIKKLQGLIEEAQEQRRDILAHQRGYEWASKIDMDKIHDWPKLFSLPNVEVRKRFFTDKPDYSDL